MEEAKLTNIQRNKINYHLRNGDTLPPAVIPRKPNKAINTGFTSNFRQKFDARRRSLDLIKQSGAYERHDPSIVGPFREPTHLAKIRLQSIMSGIKNTPPQRSVKRQPDTQECIGPLEQIDQSE